MKVARRGEDEKRQCSFAAEHFAVAIVPNTENGIRVGEDPDAAWYSRSRFAQRQA